MNGKKLVAKYECMNCGAIIKLHTFLMNYRFVDDEEIPLNTPDKCSCGDGKFDLIDLNLYDVMVLTEEEIEKLRKAEKGGRK